VIACRKAEIQISFLSTSNRQSFMEVITFLDRSTLLAPLRQANFVHVWREYPFTQSAELIDRIEDATVLITNKVQLTAEVLNHAPNLKFVAACATGANHIDLEVCRKRSIPVSNIRDYAVHAVPEHTLMLLFALARNLLSYREDLRAGAWHKATSFCLTTHPIRDLAGMVLAVVGMGSLGHRVAHLAKQIGMTVWQVERKNATVVRKGYVSWQRAIQEADAITLHCPLNNETHHLIGNAELQAMKKDVLLINTSRGGLIDEVALARALQSNQLGGVGLDVLREEPPTAGNPLLDMNLPNLIITPHNAWTSAGAMSQMAEQLIQNLEAFAGGIPRNRVA
jgi:glycerate dehydrogenase